MYLTILFRISMSLVPKILMANKAALIWIGDVSFTW